MAPSACPSHHTAATNKAKQPPMRWAQAVAAYVGDSAKLLEGGGLVSNSETAELEVQQRLQSIMEAKRGRNSNSKRRSSIDRHHSDAASSIPTFFHPRAAPGSMEWRTQRLAKLRFLEKQSQLLLQQNELEILWSSLRQHHSSSGGNGSSSNTEEAQGDDAGADRINYDDFMQVAAECNERIGPKCLRFFSAATFLTFEADDFGRIAIMPFYLYVMRWSSLTQSRIEMCRLDRDDDGYLSPEDMEAFVKGMVPSLPFLGTIEASFLPLYCKIAARKFLFFCDPQRRGKLLIRELLLSPVLSELLEFRQEMEGEEQQAILQDNWFAPASALRVYHMFVALDADGNGSLSKSELQAYGEDTLTDIFIERVFDEHVRKGKGERGTNMKREMGLESFLDLVLAMENKHTPEGMAYIFKCLDLNNCGYLTITDVYTLFRSVQRRWMEGGNYELLIEDVKDEIWDMVRPRDPLRVTLEDILECRQGDTVCSMLIDIAGFWAHDNRENLVAQQSEAEVEAEA